MNPTIKALKNLEQHFDPDGGNVFADLIVEDEEYFQIKNLSEDQYDLLRAALRTLIDLHQDVEGDMPQEIWAVMHITVNDLEQIGMYTQSMPTNPEKAQRYHRADTHINELTRRISNDKA